MIHKQGIIPEGKGIFIHYLYRLAGGDMAALADQLKADGYQWAAPKMQDGQYDFTPHNQMALMEQFAKELKRVGILLVGWGYIYGETSAYRKLRNWANREADKTLELIARFQPVAWMVNAEKEHKNHSNAGKSAAKYMNLVKSGMEITNDAIKEIPIGLSSYKFPDQHNSPPKWTFPWLEFLSRSDFAAPQVYWLGATDDDAPEYQLEKSIEQHKKYGAEGLPFLVAGCVKADNTSWVSSPEQMENFNDAVFNHPDVIGCNYWTKYYLSLFPVLEEIVYQFDWDAIPEPPIEPPTDDKDAEQDFRLDIIDAQIAVLSEQLAKVEELVYPFGPPVDPPPPPPPPVDPPPPPNDYHNTYNYAYKGTNKANFYRGKLNEDSGRTKLLLTNKRVAWNNTIKLLGFPHKIGGDWFIRLNQAGIDEGARANIELALHLEDVKSFEQYEDVRYVEFEGARGFVFANVAQPYKNGNGDNL